MIVDHYDSLSVYSFELFRKFSGLFHFISARKGGVSRRPYRSLNLSFQVGDERESVLRNRSILAHELGIPLGSITVGQQVHGGNVFCVTECLRGTGSGHAPTQIRAADALVSDVPGICLAVLLADCVPVLLFDPVKECIGIVHAGWRGTIQRIAQSAVRQMQELFRTSAEHVLAGIGPSIGPCCYEIDKERMRTIKEALPEKNGHLVQSSKDGHWCFDLWEASKDQLLEAGILEENIETASLCTSCESQTFFSYRRENGKTGRFAAGIMLR